MTEGLQDERGNDFDFRFRTPGERGCPVRGTGLPGMCIVTHRCRVRSCHPIRAACQICHAIAGFFCATTHCVPVCCIMSKLQIIFNSKEAYHTGTSLAASPRKAATVWQIWHAARIRRQGRTRHRCVTIHMPGSPVPRTGHPFSPSGSAVDSRATPLTVYTSSWTPGPLPVPCVVYCTKL
jgi:hypothetical protein